MAYFEFNDRNAMRSADRRNNRPLFGLLGSACDLRSAFRTRLGRQLQHGHALPFGQACHPHDLSVGEFQRIMMRVRICEVHLPEAGNLLPGLAEPPARQKVTEQMVDLDLLLESNLSPGKKADRHIRLSDCSETACAGVVEPGRHQLVGDSCRA
ncbi:MAG: hypothetical protein K2Z80_21860 [Xanthobacteraceae bacterium]|nr:hypothetical protein [Xanthobacteraceae bacterium]